MNASGLLGWWQMRGWSRSTSMTAGELEVVRAILPSGDPRAEKLFRQAATAPYIERTILPDGSCRVHIPYVLGGEDLVEVQRNCHSPPLTVVDAATGRRLTFRIALFRSGFLNDLVGTVSDGGNWPKGWRVGASLPQSPVSYNWLPPLLSEEQWQHILRDIGNWCGAEPTMLLRLNRDVLWVGVPASDLAVSETEIRIGTALPSQYRQFVSICDGLSIRRADPYSVAGTADVELLKVDPTGGALAVVTDCFGDGVVFVRCGGATAGTVAYLGLDSAKPEELGDFRRYVAKFLGWAASGLSRVPWRK